MAASFLKLGKGATSATQHLAAGIVLAAATAELLPEIMKQHEVAPIVIGGGIGMALMLAVRKIGNQTQGSIGLLATVGVDVFIDGLVLGIGFEAGARAGLLLTLALTAEVLFPRPSPGRRAARNSVGERRRSRRDCSALADRHVGGHTRGELVSCAD